MKEEQMKQLLKEMQANCVKGMLKGAIYEDEKAEQKAVAIDLALNLIETQKAELERLKEYKKISELTKISCCTAQNCEALNNAIREGLENNKLKEEIEKKDKRISDLEFALMDMVLQFADEDKEQINTMGLSALEIAFTELDLYDPIYRKEVEKKYTELATKYYGLQDQNQ